MDDWVFAAVRWAVLLRHLRLALWYRKADGERRLPNPAAPRNFNEKFFWQKIYDHNPMLTEVSDKLRVRDWLIRNQINIDAPPMLWVGTDPAAIPDEMLARGVVVKANHGSETNRILHAASPNRAAFNRRMRGYLRKPQGRKRLEWAYFGIERKLMVEDLIPDISMEFKFYTFGHDIVRFVIIYDRFTDICADVWVVDEHGNSDRTLITCVSIFCPTRSDLVQ